MTFPSLPEQQSRVFNSEREQVKSLYSEAVHAEIVGQPETLSDQASKLLEELQKIDDKEAQDALKYSIAGKIGTGMETVSQFAGFDWRTNIALVGGFAAKEVIVSTLGTAYSMGEIDAEASDSLSDKLFRSPNWNKVIAVAALIFIMFYAPCFVTVVCIARESSWGGSIK